MKPLNFCCIIVLASFFICSCTDEKNNSEPICVEGKVYDDSTKKPIFGAYVQIAVCVSENNSGHPLSNIAHSSSDATDSSGFYSISIMGCMDNDRGYYLEVQKEGYKTKGDYKGSCTKLQADLTSN